MSQFIHGRGLAILALLATAGVGLAACGGDDKPSGGGGNGAAAKAGGKKIALLLPESKTTRYEAQDRPLFVQLVVGARGFLSR